MISELDCSFPPYLEEGSTGEAVDDLNVILCMLGYGEGLVRDSAFGPMTVAAVKRLQEAIGFGGDDVDGKFGPGTRAALKAQTGIDVSLVPATRRAATYWFGAGADESGHLWPPADEDLDRE